MKANKKIGRLWESVKTLPKCPNFWFCLLFTILNLTITKWVLNANGVGHFKMVAFAELFVEALLIIVVIIGKKKNWSIEKKFLLIAIPLGIGYMVLLPPGQNPDEIAHFSRAYGIASGTLLAEKIDGKGGGSELPSNINSSFFSTHDDLYYSFGDKIFEEPAENSLQSYPNTAIYNFVGYLPQAIAGFIGKSFNLPILMTAYLMRIFGFVVWLVLIYFAIKITPRFKLFTLLIALTPITLQEATAISMDGLAIGLSIFLVAFVLRLIYDKKTVMNKKELIILYILAIFIGTCKIVYAPLVLLFFLIPYERFGSKKKKWLHAGIMAFIFLAINLSWMLISAGLETTLIPGVDAKEQLLLIVKHPFSYFSRIIISTSAHMNEWMFNITGTTLGRLDIGVPIIYFYIAFVFSIVLLLQGDEKFDLSKRDKWVFATVFCLIVLLIYTSEYLEWTPYNAEIIEGIQGRYFLPIATIIPILLCKKESKKSGKKQAIVTEDKVFYYGILINMIALICCFAINA